MNSRTPKKSARYRENSNADAAFLAGVVPAGRAVRLNMSTENATSKPARPSLLRNWLSLTGLVIVIGSLFSFFLLFLLDMLAHGSNPYMGILTFVVAPAILMLGLFLTGAGAWRERRKLGQAAGGLVPQMVVDLSRPRDRKIMGGFIVGSLVFLLLTAMGSYHTYHFTESTEFCGQKGRLSLKRTTWHTSDTD